MPADFVNREKEIAFVIDKVSRLTRGQPFAPEERVVHFVGSSGIGKSYLLARCYELLAKEPKCLPLLVQLQMLGGGSKDFVDEFLVAIHEAFCAYKRIAIERQDKKTRKQFISYLHRTINTHGKDQVIIVLLDEINTPQRKELQDIEENLLEELLHGNGRVVLITAGRSHPMLNDFALRPNAANTFLLTAFDERTTGLQLEKLKPGSESLAVRILELGGGVPGNNTKLLKHVVGNPPNIADELRAVQILLADAKREIADHFHPMMEAICVLQAFFPEDITLLVRSHPVLGEEWNEARIKDVFPELKQIQIGPGGLINWDRDKRSWVVDEPTRGLLERELKMRDQELWRKLHCAAFQMYSQWAKELKSKLYSDKADYHQQCLQSAGIDCTDRGNEG